MTTVDVLYRYTVPPTEHAILALARLREVYGVRAVSLDERQKTIRIEFDSTRLTEPVIHQLLRRTGVDVTEKVQLFATPPPPAPVPAA